MGMGMSVVPQVWQQFVDLVFQDDLIKRKQNLDVIMDDTSIHLTAKEHMDDLNWCIVYLDDIIIFSDTKEEHLKRLEAVFQKLFAAGLKLKPSKCFFFREEIEYLGHVVSGKGIATNPKKVEAVAKWPTPKTVYDVRSFLGFVGYYRRFIKDFSKIAKPIREVITGLEN